MAKELDSATRYRMELVEMVKASGDYLSANADLLVDRMELKTDVSITINYAQFGLPDITISQSHSMKEVNEVVFKCESD